MRNRIVVMALVAGVALVMAAGGIFASNMGFKLNYTLNAPGAGSLAGDNTLGLPFNRQAGLDLASNLRTDIGTGFVSLAQFDTATGGFPAPYTGVKGSGPDFSLEACKGYFAKMNADVNYIVVGSHNPSQVCALLGPGAGSLAGDNLFAPPYHTTAATAADIRTDIGTGFVSIAQFDRATGGYPAPYTGVKGSGPDFPIEPGKAYFVKMNATVNYTPSHY